MTNAPPRAAAADLLRSYGSIQKRLLRELTTLTRWIAAEQKAGRPISRARLLRQQRFRDLLTQTAVEMDRYARLIEQTTVDAATAAAAKARIDAVAAIEKALGPGPPGVSMAFNSLPVGAVNDITARLGDGQPLRELLDGFGTDAAERAREALVEGVGLGLAPRATAAAVRRALDISAVRAMTIVRTEQLRAYRNSSLQTYQANSSVVKGWRWRCARQTRTCAMCWAMDGTEFTVEDTLDSHPNCRCVMQPITKSWAELGFTGIPELPEPEPGATIFARLSEDRQREILGPGKYELFRTGTPLSAFVEQTQSRVWGKGRRERALKEIVNG
jgi:SPP1 gp7 family putative phage head morphogenesis protein